MHHLFFLTIIFCLIFENLANINIVGPTITTENTQCLISLINDNFKKPGLVIVATTLNVSMTPVAAIRNTVLKELHDRLNFTVETVTPDDGFDDDNEFEDNDGDKDNIDEFVVLLNGDYYVLVVQGFTEFKKTVKKLVTLRTWNSEAKFLILCYRYFEPSFYFQSYPEKILTYLFKHKVVWAVVAIPHNKNFRKTMIYGWKPYDPPQYCGYVSENATGRLIVENTCMKGEVEHHNEILNRPLPLDMEGCEIRAIALLRPPFVNKLGEENFVGIERMLISEVGKEVNFKVNYNEVNATRGEKDRSGNWNGALSMLQDGGYDILFGGIFPDNEVHEDFEASTPYFAVIYTWVVPKAPQVPAWAALVVIFKHNVWLSAFGVLLLSIFSWVLLGRLSRDSVRNHTTGHCALNAWCTTLGFCGYMQPHRQSLRVFFVFFNIYCVLFITAYQTKLIDVLKYPSFEHQIESVNEMIESDIKWGGAEELHDIYENDDVLDNIVEKSFIDINDTFEAITDVSVNNNFSLIFSRIAMSYFSAEIDDLNDDFGNYDFYLFDANEFSSPLEFLSLKGFPFMDRFDFVLRVFKQAGIMSKIRNWFDTVTERKRARLMAKRKKLRSNSKALSLQHLQGGFYALAVGYAGGTAVLLIEILINSNWFKEKIIQMKKIIFKLNT